MHTIPTIIRYIDLIKNNQYIGILLRLYEGYLSYDFIKVFLVMSKEEN